MLTSKLQRRRETIALACEHHDRTNTGGHPFSRPHDQSRGNQAERHK
jgi:hypothetical protein